MDLQGKHALVTGGGRGIGRMIALRLAEAGADVALTSRKEEDLSAVADEIRALGRKAASLPGDVSVEEDVNRVAAAAEKFLGGIDILINNAATIARGGVLDIPISKWEKVIRTNLTGAFLMTRAVAPGMIRRGEGTIVMVSSTAGKRGSAGWSAYAASKFGLMGLAHSLLYELREDGIRVVVVSPSAVDTRPMDRGGAREGGKGAPLRSEDVAESVLYAVSLPPRALVREVEVWATNP